MKTTDEDNTKKWGTISMLLLIISYWFIRHYLFSLHGLKQCPNILALLSILVILIFNIRGNRIVPAASIVGFVGGFILAMVFKTDGADPGGGAANNAWIIWTGFYLVSVIGAIVLGSIANKRLASTGDGGNSSI